MHLLQPSFGASLHILKVEIGGDSQSSGECVYSTVEVSVIFVASIKKYFHSLNGTFYLSALQKAQKVRTCTKNGTKIITEGMSGG